MLFAVLAESYTGKRQGRSLTEAKGTEGGAKDGVLLPAIRIAVVLRASDRALFESAPTGTERVPGVRPPHRHEIAGNVLYTLW